MRNPVFMRSLLPVLFCLLRFCSPVHADAPTPAVPATFNRPLVATLLPSGAKPPTIDGKLDDMIWQTAPHADTYYDPQTGKPTPDLTETRLLYDKKYLYISFYCHDSQPDKIVARETVRDADLDNDDNVRVEIDPFLTYKFNDYSLFFVNAMGTRRSQLSGGRAGKVEWQGDWEASTQRVADGWTAEMRIPWEIISYPHSDKPMTMGINFRRKHQRTQTQSAWSDLGPQGFNEREGLWQGVQPPTNAWRPRLSFLPYLMPSAYRRGGNSQARVGLDARFQPTPELTTVGTLNPDFTSVEGAVEGIGFSRSERFVPDRRPFFLEGSNFLGIGQNYELGSMFNSARIKQMDAGLKAYGKLTPNTTLGVLGTIAPGTQSNFVGQIRREFNATSNVDLMMIQRLSPGEDNTVLVAAPRIRRGKWSLNGQVAQSFGPGAGGRGYTGSIDLEDKNFFGTVRYRQVAENFLNRLGFIPFTDYKGFTGYFNHSVQYRKGFLRSVNVDFNPDFDWHMDGRPFRRRASGSFGIETRNDLGFFIFGDGGKFDNDTDLTFGGGMTVGVTNRFRQYGIKFTTGKQANLPYSSFGPSFSFRLGKAFDISYNSFFQSYQGFGQQHVMTFNYLIDQYRSWGGRMVINNSAVNFYLSYRNAGRKGLDTYFIIGDPNAASFVQRFLVKFVFAI